MMLRTGKAAGNVYFIKPVGLDGPIKIGFSQWPKQRLMSYAGWSPIPIELIGHVPALREDEHFLHSCFFDVHSHLEWFHPSRLLRDTIRTIVAANTVDVVRHTLTPKGHHRSGKRGPYMTRRRIAEAEMSGAQT